MKKLLLYILFVAVGVILIDTCYRVVILTFCGDTLDKEFKFKTVTKPCKVVILGASRAARCYNVKMLEDSLKVPAYNYGERSTNIFQQYLSILKAIENGRPSIVLFDITSSQLSDKWVKDHTSQYYPYYWKNDTIKAIVNEVKGMNMDIQMLVFMLQNNSKLLTFLKGKNNTELNKMEYGGYMPIKYTGKPGEPKVWKVGGENYYNLTAIKYLKKIVSTCKTNNIRLIVCMSPVLGNDDDEKLFISNFCKENDVEYWDMTGSVKDPLLFYDSYHVNERGAVIFTNEIIRRIQGGFRDDTEIIN